jgi:hypothetical protein
MEIPNEKFSKLMGITVTVYWKHIGDLELEN